MRIVAEQIALRARVARALQSAGYAVELAENQKRVSWLRGKQIAAAIVVHSREFGGLVEQELRDQVPRTMVLGDGTDEILRPGHPLRGSDTFPAPELDEQKTSRSARATDCIGGEHGRGNWDQAGNSQDRGLPARPGRPHLCR